MKKDLVKWSLLALLAASCGSRESASEKRGDGSETDSLTEDSELVLSPEEEEMSHVQNMDEFFGDFIFTFIQDKKLQLERVRFPLPCVKVIQGKEQTTWFKKENWKHDPIFVSPEYYTVLFNSADEIEMENSTEYKKVDVERIYLKKKYVHNYHFEKVNGLWKLVKETYTSLKNYPLADFLNFYEHFASDSVFQRKSTVEPLRFVTVDPEDDFGTIEGTLSVDQWFAFRPLLPADEMTNVRYGQKYQNPNRMVMVKRGISNGLLDILTFEKQKGSWCFVSYEN